jgi:hypothetical protein
MRANSFQLIKSCGTRTDPAAKTESIGLQADARVVMVFAAPPRLPYRDMTNPARLSGPRHLDNFIVTRSFRSSNGTLQKRMPPLTLTATNQTAGPLGCRPSYCTLDNQKTKLRIFSQISDS